MCLKYTHMGTCTYGWCLVWRKFSCVHEDGALYTSMIGSFIDLICVNTHMSHSIQYHCICPSHYNTLAQLSPSDEGQIYKNHLIWYWWHQSPHGQVIPPRTGCWQPIHAHMEQGMMRLHFLGLYASCFLVYPNTMYCYQIVLPQRVLNPKGPPLLQIL